MNDNEKLILTIPTEEHLNEVRAYRQEFLDSGESMDGAGPLRRYEDPADWLADARKCMNPETVPEGLVQATQFLLIRECDGRVLGMLSVRHTLNDYLREYAGHIGYSVRPSERRKGYAKRMLKEGLDFCRQIGLKRVMVSCREENEASRRTILANGGVYEDTVYEPERKVRLQKYWIDIPDNEEE